MIIKNISPLFLIILPLFLSACSSRAIDLEKSESKPKTANVIVLLPVENKTIGYSCLAVTSLQIIFGTPF